MPSLAHSALAFATLAFTASAAELVDVNVYSMSGCPCSAQFAYDFNKTVYSDEELRAAINFKQVELATHRLPYDLLLKALIRLLTKPLPRSPGLPLSTDQTRLRAFMATRSADLRSGCSARWTREVLTRRFRSRSASVRLAPTMHHSAA